MLTGSHLGRGTKGNYGTSGSGSGDAGVACRPGGVCEEDDGGPRQLLQDQAFHARYPDGFLLDDAAVLSALHTQLQEDTRLLRQHGIMDYSVLLSVSWTRCSYAQMHTRCCDACRVGAVVVRHPSTQQLGFVKLGIIDMLQTYDVSKRLEHGFKVFRHGKLNPDVSAVDPDTYCHRLLDFLQRTFKVAPAVVE